MTEQGNRCARCGQPDPCEVVRGPDGHSLICPECFLKLPAVRSRLEALVQRRGDPVHRYVKWQAYVRDAGACRLCSQPLRAAEAAAALVDRRRVPELENVITVCSRCARSRRASRGTEPAAAPRSEVAPAAPTRPAPAAARAGVQARRSRLFAASAGRCNLCGTQTTLRTARLLRLYHGLEQGGDTLIVVCPDCRAGVTSRLQTQAALAPEALEQITRLTGVAPRLAPVAAGMLLELGTLVDYRRQGSERLYQFDRLLLTVHAGTVVQVRPEPGWSPLRWPGMRTLRQQLLRQRATPHLDLVTLRLPSSLLQSVERLVAGSGPGWSLELWLVQLLSQAVRQAQVLGLR